MTLTINIFWAVTVILSILALGGGVLGVRYLIKRSRKSSEWGTTGWE